MSNHDDSQVPFDTSLPDAPRQAACREGCDRAEAEPHLEDVEPQGVGKGFYRLIDDEGVQDYDDREEALETARELAAQGKAVGVEAVRLIFEADPVYREVADVTETEFTNQGRGVFVLRTTSYSVDVIE